MKLLLLLLLITGCNKFKETFKDVEIEDNYPISREYQLASRQGNFNSLKADFDIKIPDFLNEKKETEKEIEKPTKKDQTCDIFIVALDYISEKYPIKQIETKEKIIITEVLTNQITIFATDIDTFKVNSQNKELANEIKQNILLKCSIL
jgi:hypothetical protein